MKFIHFALTCLTALCFPLAGHTASPLSEAEAHEACEYVAQIPRDDLPLYIVKRGYLDLYSDGRTAKIAKAESRVAMDRDNLDITLSSDAPLPAPEAKGEQAPFVENDPDSIRFAHGLGILPFKDKFLFLHAWSEDMLFPSALEYQGVLCAFKTTYTTNIFSSDPLISEQSCKQIFADNPPPEFKEIFFSESDPRLTQLPPYSGDTRGLDRPPHAVGLADIDYQNNGHPVPLIKYQINSGAGRGCDRTFYDTLHKSDAPDGLLNKLQEASFKTCASERTHWYRFNGMIYFENKMEDGNIRQKSQEFQTLSYIKNGKVHEACGTLFKPHTEVSQYFPPYDK